MATFPQDDLTQHFLYSYQHEQKLGPTDEMLRLFVNDLIFDKSRKSIYTQDQEFGYIGNIETTVCTGKFDDYSNSYTTVISYEGNIKAYEYIPFHITGVKLDKHNYVDNKIVLGSTIDFSSLVLSLAGSKKYHYTDNCYTPPKERDIELDKIQIVVTDSSGNDTEIYYKTPNLSTKDCSILPIDKKFMGVTTNYVASIPGELKINIRCWDNVTYMDNISTVTLSYEVANYVTIGLSNASSFKTFNDIKISVNIYSKGGVASPPIITNTINVLTNDWGAETANHPYKISEINGSSESVKVNTYAFLTVPKRLQDDEIIYGNLNNGSVQEFKKIISADLSYTSFLNWCGYNGAYTEPYNMYLATARNWVGMKLSFDTRE